MVKKLSDEAVEELMSSKVLCVVCGWSGSQGECGFAHNDFCCPMCGQETIIDRTIILSRVGWLPGSREVKIAVGGKG